MLKTTSLLSLVVPIAVSLLSSLPVAAQSNPAADAQAWLNGEIIAVEGGNANMPSPEVDPSAIKLLVKNRAMKRDRTMETLDETRNRKYRLAVGLLTKDPTLMAEIRNAAHIYDIDPMMIAGAIIGEHTFNVGRTDDIQTYAVNVASWAGKWALRFSAAGFPLSDVVQLPEFKRCHELGSDYTFWMCAQGVWDAKFRGQSAYGYTFENKSLRMSFFNPISSGYSYGIGQLDPLRALMVSDMVHKFSGLPELSASEPVELYAAIIEPSTTIHYMAANLRMIIETYKTQAHFDISHNPGLVATLYNLGKENVKAGELNVSNKKLALQGDLRYPRVNFYGWFVNDREEEIRAAINAVP